MTTSSSACLECGSLLARDILYIDGGSLARIVEFWQTGPDAIIAHCTRCELVRGSIYRDTDSRVFVQHDTIIDAVAYRILHDGTFRVILPFLARFR